MKLRWGVLFSLAVSLGAASLLVSKAYSEPAAPAGIAAAIPGAPAAQEQSGWDVPPPEFREIQKKGFRDGIEGARKDFDNHRPPNVNNREEYRHPHVDASMRDDYRDGFRRGYDEATRHLEGH